MQIKNKCAYDRLVEIKDLKPNPKNPNQHPKRQIDLLSKMIKAQGWRNPIVVSNQSGMIVTGHARYEVAKILKAKKVPVDFQDFESKEIEWAHLVADNKIPELAQMEDDLTAQILKGLKETEFDMDLTGFDSNEIDLLLSKQIKQGLKDDDEIPKRVRSRNKLGYFWQLGNHRLLCGDARKQADVEKLMDSQKANILFTDPPYGIKRDEGFEGFGGFGKPIARKKYKGGWDKKRPPKSCFDLLLNYCHVAIIFGGNYFADFLPQGKHWIVWDKENSMPTFGDCELIWTNIKRDSVKIKKFIYNGLIGKENERYHATQKPVELLVQLLNEYKNKDIIADFFGGSGSTLIACEKLERQCYMMEIDPHYCDVIIKRWEDFTGQKAKRIK